jgi:hypothetical protein
VVDRRKPFEAGPSETFARSEDKAGGFVIMQVLAVRCTVNNYEFSRTQFCASWLSKGAHYKEGSLRKGVVKIAEQHG